MPSQDASGSRFVAWFEIPAQDFARAQKFYESVFAARLGVEDMNGSRMGMFRNGGDMPAGCVVSSPDHKPHYDGTIVYLDAGADLAVPLGRVAAAGGRVAVPKTLITEEAGYFAHILDTEGNRVGLYSQR